MYNTCEVDNLIDSKLNKYQYFNEVAKNLQEQITMKHWLKHDLWGQTNWFQISEPLLTNHVTFMLHMLRF